MTTTPPNVFDSPPGDFYVSTDRARLDYPWIESQLRASYWGDWITNENLEKRIKNSVCFGLYRRAPWDPNSTVPVMDKQIGFARIVTDDATHAWLCDVIVESGYRKRGLGKFLMSVIVEHPVAKTRPLLLHTRDAHAFYAKFGFGRVETMSRRPEFLHAP